MEIDMKRREFMMALGALPLGFMAAGAAFGAERKILVAYFSPTGTTKGVAGAIARTLGGDLYEITPEKPYTAADLDWHDKMSRSSVEMADEKSRPALAGALPDMGRYETVFIGYPIWWGIAPRIVQTFAEACDLKGRTVIPFCTSGGSPFGKSADLLIKAAPMARWKQGARLMAGTSDADIAAWAKGLGIARQ